jgi:Protein of unknown function (DUF4232)
VRPASPVPSPGPEKWLPVFIVVVSILALVEVAISVQLLTGQKAARPCQAAQLRASLASDDGFSGEENAMVELTNVSPKVCALKGFPRLTASTLAHRPFALGLNHTYGTNETVGPYAFPAPRTLALRRGNAAYFDVYFWDADAFPTNPFTTDPTRPALEHPQLTCVDNFYVQAFLAGQRDPVRPPVLVYGDLCAGKGHELPAAVTPYESCDPFDLPPPVTTVPRTASSWCIAPYT